MVEDGLLGKIFSAAAGVWALVAMAAVALFRAWPLILERVNERRRDAATEKSGDWDRIRAERDRYHDLLIESEADKIRWMERAITAEATLQGRGDARQEAARIVAIERTLDAAKKNGGGK